MPAKHRRQTASNRRHPLTDRLRSLIHRLSPVVHRPSPTAAGLASLVALLAACTVLPFGGLPSAVSNPKSAIRHPDSIVLPQPTTEPENQGAEVDASYPPVPTPPGPSAQIVEVRIAHVRALSEIHVRAGDLVVVGQVLAHLAGYAEAQSREVHLVALELAEARAKQTQAQAEAEADRQDAAAAHAQQVSEAETRVTTLQRRLAMWQRQQQIAIARLAQARATTAYRRRWRDILAPLQAFDPWNDLPYLVGAQNGPRGPRSDLAYREALAKAEYELHLAQLAQQIAEQEAAGTTARLEETRADLQAAQRALQHLRSTHFPTRSAIRDAQTAIDQASVRIHELRLERARAALAQTVVRSLVAGQVLEVQIERVDGNEAVVVVRIAATFSR